MNDSLNIPGKDYLIRCPRLGNPISLLYCLKENNGLPCFKTLDCWFQHFNVEEYLRDKLTEREWETVFEKPAKSKVQSLIELIEEAKKRSETG